MSYKFEEVILSNGKIYKKNPEQFKPSNKDIAIIAHVFYTDIYTEIVEYLKQLDIDFDFFVTIPPHIKNSEIVKLFAQFPSAKVFVAENRGRDVLPFLQTINHIGLRNYKYICKLHTKKTGNSPLGDVWRRLLYYDLIGSKETVNDIIKLFESDDKIGEITSKNTVLDSKRYAYGNNLKIKELCRDANIEFREDYYFSGGTMFWSRMEPLEPILRLFREGKLEFEEERGQKDHTLAHAIERFFGIVVQDMGLRIAPSPADYSKLPKDLVEDTASLILCQQYAGQDVYEKINELNDYIHELEAIAESMRLKNRLKRLPQDLVKLVTKKVNIDSLNIDTTKFKKNSKKIVDGVKAIKCNPASLKKVAYYLKRGEVKYLLTKVKEKIKGNLSSVNNFIEVKIDNYFEPFKKRKYHLGEEKIDIIVPVYNGHEYLEPMLKSLLNNTSHPFRLIVVNDASSDERVLPTLKALLVEFNDYILIENQENLGFVKSVNRALKEVQNHFVILNTDTEVPPFWIERLMYPIFKMDKIASTTPFTNSGTIASFPNFLEDNEIFEGLSVKELDNVFKEVKPEPNYAKIPTGVGFCMGVNFDLVKEIGFFDEESFGKGYGEENDWCQRAIKNGYSNLLVPNLFVYHKHGGSFPSELKQKLIQENHLKLLKKHPDYDKQIQEFITKNPHEVLRKLLIIVASSKNKPLWVMFDHNLGGGANHYANELIDKKVNSLENTLLIRYDFYRGYYLLSHKYKDYKFDFALKSLDEIDELLSRIDIKEIFLNSLVSYPNQKELLEYIDRLSDDSTLIIPMHDFFAVCPSYTLLNKDGKYCNVPDIKSCQECMRNNKQEWKNFFLDDIDIKTYRELWGNLLAKSSKILVFSTSSKEILLKAYPKIGYKIDIVPHTIEPLPVVEPIQKEINEPIVIGVLGAINYAKGASVIKELVKRIDEQNLNMKVVVIGDITEPISSSNFTYTGRYKKEELPYLINRYKVDIFLIPSIWPETFSYTTQEIISMNMPLMVFNLGAPAQRVKEYEKGYVIDKIDVDEIIKVAKNIR